MVLSGKAEDEVQMVLTFGSAWTHWCGADIHSMMRAHCTFLTEPLSLMIYLRNTEHKWKKLMEKGENTAEEVNSFLNLLEAPENRK